MKIHFVGINGVSMSALADLARSYGHTVTGSDRATGGHDGNNVVGCDLVVYTSAVPADNPELVRAKQLKIPVLERAKYLGEIAAAYDRVIAVAGCHGKSTATAMLGAALASRLPTVHVGVKGGSKIGAHSLFITEACEYRRSFISLHADLGVILNIGYDHPDFYKTQAELEKAYADFAAGCKNVLANGDDKTAALSGTTFGKGANNKYRAVNIKNNGGYYSFVFAVDGKPLETIKLSAPGEHNVMNALAALSAAHIYGADIAAAAKSVSEFTGIPRRFEFKGIAFGKAVFSDYAHHPAEIAATIKTAREMFPSVAVVFQPHTYSRTAALLGEFAEALKAADTVVLAPIYAARESAVDGVSSNALCRKIIDAGNPRTYCFSTFGEIVRAGEALREKSIIFMGAGDIERAAEIFVDEYDRSISGA